MIARLIASSFRRKSVQPVQEQIKQLTLPPVPEDDEPIETYDSAPAGWQTHYWRIIQRRDMASLPETMQDALIAWWDCIIPREGDHES